VDVLANSQYQWFWWIAPILVGGYLRKVVIPRVKGRRVEE